MSGANVPSGSDKERSHAHVQAGAKFVISPGVNPEVVSWCVQHDMPVFPGIATATEIQVGMQQPLTMQPPVSLCQSDSDTRVPPSPLSPPFHVAPKCRPP